MVGDEWKRYEFLHSNAFIFVGQKTNESYVNLMKSGRGHFFCQTSIV